MFGRVFVVLWRWALRRWFQFVFWLFWSINVFRQKRRVAPVLDVYLLQSATQLATKIRRREISSYELVQAYIDRIRQVNPHLNAIVQECFEEALEKARDVDSMSEFEIGETNDQPFLGVPFTLKDCVLVQGLVCTAGIRCRSNTRADQSAVCVSRMRSAGAILVAATNVSEVCMWWESANTVYGRTANPYDTRRIVGGSSGGEGALIAAGGSLLGIGSDIGGSIRMPAFFNGIFGHKPTKLTVNDEGTIPECFGFQKEMHCVGPLCRYAEDLRPMLRVLSGDVIADKMGLGDKVLFKDLKYFYMEGMRTHVLSPLSSQMRQCLRKTVQYFETRYDVACHRLDLPLIHYGLAIWLNDMEGSDGPTFSQEMTDCRGDVNPFMELFSWLLGRSDHTFPALGLAALERLQSKSGGQKRKDKLKAWRKMLQTEIEQLLEDNGVLLFPSHPTTAPFHNQPVCQPFNFAYTAIFNSLGFPVTQCPLGLDTNGLPLGVQIVGPMHKDGITISVAEELSYAFGGWKNSGY